MKTLPDDLPDDVSELKKMVLALQSRCQYLEEQFLLARQKQFGQSSEAHQGQGELFNEAEHILDTVDTTESAETESTSSPRKQPKRIALPAELERKVIVQDIADEDKVCDCCGGQLHQMGEVKSEQLEFIPAQVKVIQSVRLKYSCRTCEKSETQVKIHIAPRLPSPIPKSIATPSLLSQIITSKYQYGLPLYRQESMFAQSGIALNRKTMSEWSLKSAELLVPVIERWHELILQQPAIRADETTLNVISEDKAKCYMWLYCSGGDSPSNSPIPNIVLYDYHRTRAGQCAVDFLQGYQGYLQADGYQGYEKTQAMLVGCWAHARRKFVEAETAQGKNKTGKANWAISHIKKLYRIERAIKALSAAEKTRVRREKALPLLNQFKTWLDKSVNQVPPKSAIGNAIGYSLNQWDKLKRYIENGELSIDNNRAERAVRPFVIGRKNWLFANTARGANASAVLYSIIETAKANSLIPFDYLTLLLTELPKQPEDLDYLMPWNVEL